VLERLLCHGNLQAARLFGSLIAGKSRSRFPPVGLASRLLSLVWELKVDRALEKGTKGREGGCSLCFSILLLLPRSPIPNTPPLFSHHNSQTSLSLSRITGRAGGLLYVCALSYTLRFHDKSWRFSLTAFVYLSFCCTRR
jgi:hypothetical protein